MGAALRRGCRSRSRTTRCAPAIAESASPTVPRATIAVLSGQPSWSRVPDASDASAVARGGSGSYWTLTASSASASRVRPSATTTATGSPTWRTTSRASTGWAQTRPLGEPPYAVGTLGVTAPRSAALQARATPGRRRAASVATQTSRAWASVLRTTPRCKRPSRARSSRKRPPPVRSRSSPLRSGEEPIISRGNLPRLRKILLGRLSGDARGRPSLDGLAADDGAGAGQPDRRHRIVHVLQLRRPACARPRRRAGGLRSVLSFRVRSAVRARLGLGQSVVAGPRSRRRPPAHHGRRPASRAAASVRARRYRLRRLGARRPAVRGDPTAHARRLHDGARRQVHLRQHLRRGRSDDGSHVPPGRAPLAPGAAEVL